MLKIYVFDWFEAVALVGSKMCCRIFVQDLSPSFLQTEIPMIFCRHISLVVPECSAKVGPNCSGLREMAAIINQKITFLHFSPNIFLVIPTNLGATLLGVRGTLSSNFSSNDRDLRKWRPFLGLKLHFCTFSNSILFIPTKVGRDIARGKAYLFHKFDLKRS